MIVPERLLKMMPLDALIAQMDYNLTRPLRASHLRIGEPEVVDGVRTSILAEVDKSKAIVDLWGRVGEVTFEFNRIDLGYFTRNINRTLSPELPADAQALLQSILAPYGVPVAPEDVLEANFTDTGQVTIYAGEKSYRWVGETVLTLQRLVHDIAKLILVDKFSPSFSSAWNSAAVKQTLSSYLNILNSNSLPTPVTMAMFTLGTPIANGPFNAGDNTQIDLTFSGAPYYGTVRLTYMRRAFEKSWRKPVAVSGSNVSRTQSLAGFMSAQMGCLIAPSDIVQENIAPIAVGESRLIKVTFAASSLAYVGEVMIQYRRTT